MSGPATAAGSDVTLFVDPFTHHYLGDRLFEPGTATYGGDNILGTWIYLREWFQRRGVAVFTADRLVRGERTTDLNVYVSLGRQESCRELAKRPDVVMSAFFAFEAPIVEPSLYRNLAWVKDCVKRVYSFSDAEGLAPFVTEPIGFHRFCLPYPFQTVDEETWRRTRRDGFLVMINANKLPRLDVNELYTERMRAVEFFARTREIDLYGIGWDQPPFRMGKTWMPHAVQRVQRRLLAWKHSLRPDPLLEAARSVWRGKIESKFDALGRYTFAVCFENQVLNGWITEKLFDCFRAGTIPIYWGAPDIGDYVPAEAFIDFRRFAGYAELREFLHGLTSAEINAYREAARSFVESPRFHPFTAHAFVERCASILAEDTGLALAER